MRVFLGITGASGAPYAARLLEALSAAGCEVGLAASATGDAGARHRALRRAHAGAGGRAGALRRRPHGRDGVGSATTTRPCERLRQGRRLRRLPHVFDVDGQHARHRSDGESHPPGCLGRAEGAAEARARATRTPLSSIHLRGLATLHEAGAVILFAAPGFYHRQVDRRPRRLRRRALPRPARAREHTLSGRWGR